MTIVLYGLFGAPGKLLGAVGAYPVAEGGGGSPTRQLTNLVHELSIGLGVTPPRIGLIDDRAPNALSVRQWRRRTLVVTTGLLQFPRDEVEAVLSHELAHLHAADARWITAAESSVARAHGVTDLIVGIGGLVAALGFDADLWLSLIAIGILLTIVGGAGRFLARRVLSRIRAESDELSDVAAIMLARNPESLGRVCARLAADDRVVAVNPAAVRLLWFKLVRDQHARELDAERELDARADAAYREARVPRPLPSPP